MPEPMAFFTELYHDIWLIIKRMVIVLGAIAIMAAFIKDPKIIWTRSSEIRCPLLFWISLHPTDYGFRMKIGIAFCGWI